MVDFGKFSNVVLRDLSDFFKQIFSTMCSQSFLLDLHVKSLLVCLYGSSLPYAAVIFIAIFHRHDGFSVLNRLLLLGRSSLHSNL